MAVFMPSIMDRAESGLLSIIISALVISFWVVRTFSSVLHERQKQNRIHAVVWNSACFISCVSVLVETKFGK